MHSCRRSRESGLHEEVELEKEEGIFDYVDDREYAKIVQQRQEEGFVLDDGMMYRVSSGGGEEGGFRPPHTECLGISPTYFTLNTKIIVILNKAGFLFVCFSLLFFSHNKQH